MANWKKTIGWTAIVVGALMVIAIVAGALLLKSAGFHRYVLAKIVDEASQATGARVELQNFDFHLKTLTADIYGLTVHGSEAAGEKPLLQVEKATVSIKITSFIHRQVNLSELLVDHPEINLAVDAQGHSNLPTPPPSNQKSSRTNVFDLAVGHVLLTRGDVFLRDRKIPVDANLFDLRTEIHFHQMEKKYVGSLGYGSGTVHYPQIKSMPHSLDASFDASPTEINLKPLVIRVGGSRLSLAATVRDYSNAPVANGKYDILLHTQDFAGLSSVSTSGDLTLAGTLDYRDTPNQALLRNAKLNGRINSNGLAIVTEQAAVKIRKISGQYQLANGNFDAEGFAFDLLNGTLKADGRVQHLDTTPQSKFHIALAGISLQSLKASLRGASNEQLPVIGTINAQADAGWIGSVSNVKATSSVLLNGALVASNQKTSQSFPLKADVKVNYDGPRSLITVPTGNIQLPATTITAQGSVGNRSNLSIKAVSSNLHQLMLLASAFQKPNPGQTSATPPANVEGAATLNALVQGSLQSPKISAQLSATKLQVNQGQFSSLQLALNASPAGIEIQNGSLNAVPRGQLRFSGRTGLRKWSYRPDAPISASLQISHMSLAMLGQLATKSYPIVGDLDGNLELKGSGLDPVGQGKLQITKAKIQDEPVQNVTLQFQASGGQVRTQLMEGSNRASLNFTPKTKAYEVKLDVPPQEVSKLHTLQAKNVPVKGLLSITASGAGTLDDPNLAATIQMQKFQMRQTSVDQVRINLNVAQHLAKVALASTGGPADLKGNATVHLSPGYYTEASLDTSKIPLEPILAVYYPARPNGLTGETELHASIKGPLTDKTKLEAHLTIPTFSTRYQSLELANTSPIRVDYANSLIVLQPSGFKGTGTSLEFQGRVPLAGSAPIRVGAKGSIDLRLAQMVNPDLQTGGKISLDVSAGGTVKTPGVQGQIKIQNASFASQDLPVGIQNLNADMKVSDTGIQITDAAGELGGGELKFGGSVIYKPSLQANLSLTARSVRLRYPEGMRSVFDSDLTLTGDSNSSVLQGRVLVDSLSFTSDFDIQTFMGQFTGTSAPPTGQSFADRLKLQIAVQSSSQLNAGTAQLGIEGSANLRVIGTASDPVVVGRTDITSGDIFFMKRDYHLEQGIINFVNPNKTEPVLNMLITTTINQYNLSLRLTGPIEKLQTSYISDPPLPPVDIINLIARGQTTQEGAPESFGASTVLAQGLSQVESAVGSNISKLTGISGLQIDPTIGGNNANPSARIGMQKRVTKNFIFTFSTDVTQPQNEIVQGEYQLNKRWSVSVVRNESGGFAVDGRFHTNF